MSEAIDKAWLNANPLPEVPADIDKNARGRVLVVGGAEFVPGALRLTGEAALRAGAGKLQLATVSASAMALGVQVPEASMLALPADADGEIAAAAADLLLERLDRCDALVLGPGMSPSAGTVALVSRLLDGTDEQRTIVLDAAAITASRDLAGVVARHGGRVVLTPHQGEMASLTGATIEAIRADPAAIAKRVAGEFNAVVLLKGNESVIATPQGDVYRSLAGSVGLATGGSGDVLAGIIGGLAARGATPLVATAWGSWAHGQAGERLAERDGPIGFLARELLPLIPRLLQHRLASG